MAGRAELHGVYAVAWCNIDIDGASGLDPNWVQIGSELRWHGRATRLDAHDGLLSLHGAYDIRKGRARAMAERLTGLAHRDSPEAEAADAPQGGLLLTDGHRRYTLRLVAQGGTWLAVFADGLPPPGAPLWVVETRNVGQAQTPPQSVICFASDTVIATPDGPCPIDQITQGDRVLTRDNGPQPVVWAGRSNLSGLALRRHPHLRPIRLRRGALGGVPDEDLRISPEHRVLVTGQRAQSLFGCDEVLVRAADLLDYRSIAPDLALHGVVYVHLLLEDHQVLFANGLPCESFHPGMAAPDMLRHHRADLRGVIPDVVDEPHRYGPTARRCLTAGEAALLAA
ncbi:Hint domain-containing protein [Roseibaca sp. V10]|uniref:Hint domain-containing protein n=1 Tax=Roseinatronobacter domitianus TaxID=2940293 RepID=A0ABT0M1S9_9RHOB|nr:Hint domain-containing protein [Roseibaca domitiana]MCL1628815.1 Hint domain-containing protein [Roseibaca domitiana]